MKIKTFWVEKVIFSYLKKKLNWLKKHDFIIKAITLKRVEEMKVLNDVTPFDCCIK